jgi:hypothetical protein
MAVGAGVGSLVGDGGGVGLSSSQAAVIAPISRRRAAIRIPYAALPITTPC